MARVFLTLWVAVLVGCSGSDERPPAAPAEPVTPVGLWAIDGLQVSTVNTRLEAAGRPARHDVPGAFYFDGRTVTLKLLAYKSHPAISPDECYRLTAELVADELYYRHPFGDWLYLATFRDGAFEVEDQGVTWRYNPVPADQASPACARLLPPRDLFDYRLTGVRPDPGEPVKDNAAEPVVAPDPRRPIGSGKQ